MERLNKVLAQLGYGSRRSVDELIAKGRVKVNSNTAEMGQKVSPTDALYVDNKAVARRSVEPMVLALNKPAGVTTTRKDPFAKVTVMEFLPKQYHHLYPIGRLDKNSRGLLLLTNDGDLALKLEHPSHAHEKEYNVEVVPLKSVTAKTFEADIERLKHEIVDDQAQTKPVKITHAKWDSKRQRGHATLILQEGKKRQIRHIFRAVGYIVTDLQRTRIASIRLGGLKEGEYVVLDPTKIVL